MTIPLEDVDIIVLENNRITVTVKLLEKCAENKVALFICDDKHMPVAVQLPFNSYHRPLNVYKLQQNVSAPLKKQIWKKIVTYKIMNQAKCIALSGADGEESLRVLAKQVKSGDSTNREAVAAQKYFKKLFGTSFKRRSDSEINSAMNYGYAIIRGCISRYLVAHGFLPFLGIMHQNELNKFNLADDFLEVYRPFVDIKVYELVKVKAKNDFIFDKEIKHEMVKILQDPVQLNGLNFTVSNSIEKIIESYHNVLQTKDYDKLLLPELVGREEIGVEF